MPDSKSKNRYRRAEPFWASLSDEKLLNVRFCDLDLGIEGTELEPRIQKLYRELEARGLHLRPPCWLSSEWFSPHDTPGIAIPFYLAHPRLKRLEYHRMKDVEGGARTGCLQLLRHEAGHAYEAAYRLGRRDRWLKIFGRASKPYPDYYSPKPFSRNFVLHLDWWYAQSHPVEDFAETFAVWLRPGALWRNRYKDWPALRKLEYVEELMPELAAKSPLVKPRAPIEPLHRLQQKLGDYYREKERRYGSNHAGFYNRDLRRLFPPATDPGGYPSASALLRRIGKELPRRVPHWTAEYAYTIHFVLKDMIQRCRQLGLRVTRPERETESEAAILLTRQATNYRYSKKRRLAM